MFYLEEMIQVSGLIRHFELLEHIDLFFQELELSPSKPENPKMQLIAINHT